MLKCKIAAESGCGKECCCYDCTEAKNCKSVCPTYEEFGKRVLDECEELEHVELVSLNEAMPQTINMITALVKEQKEIEEKITEMRESLRQAMEKYDVKSFENDNIRLTYIAPTTRTSIDSTKLKKEHPEIAEAYQKVSNVKASVKIEIK